MARKSETTVETTVKVKKENAVFDGNGGFYEVGADVECVDEEAAQSLRDKGMAE